MTDPGTPLHEAIESLLGAYALDATEPDETLMVEAHLSTCPRCRAEVDAHREMAAALGNSVVPLPPGLWGRIAEDAGRRRRRHAAAPSPLGRHHSAEGATPRPFATVPAAEPVPIGGHRTARRDRRWVVGAMGAAAVVALIAFLTVGWVHTNVQLSNARNALAQARSNAQIESALSTPGHRTVVLRSPAGSTVATAVVVPGGQGYFVSSSMPTLASTETYQLWAMFGDRAVSLGLMGNHPGHAIFTLASGAPTQLAVTVEPAGGVAQPDRLPVAAGSLDA
jgi:anti-sigma factor RsiW